MTNYVVTTLMDDGAGVTGLTLRDAIAKATQPGDTITFDKSFLTGNGGLGPTNTLVLNAPLEIKAGQKLTIDGDINGDGAPDVKIEDSSGALSTLLKVDAGANATLRNVVMGDSDVSAASGAAGRAGGDGKNGFNAQDNDPNTFNGSGTSGTNAKTSGVNGSKGTKAVGGIDNEGTLTLEHDALVDFFVGGGLGGAGGRGGEGGLGGSGDDSIPSGDANQWKTQGGAGGNGGSGSNAGSGAAGGDAAGAIYNGAGATLTVDEVAFIDDNAIAGKGGDGGNGGYGGDGGNGGEGLLPPATPGNGGDGANGGNGGDGGSAGGAILNYGAIVIQGLSVGAKNSATVGAGGLAGLAGLGEGGGTTQGVLTGTKGSDGIAGVTGKSGSATDGVKDFGSLSGALSGGAGIASILAAQKSVEEGSALPTSNPWSKIVSAPKTTVTFFVSRIGDLSQAASVHWAVHLDPSSETVVNAADFAAGQALSGVVSFAANSALAAITLTINPDTEGEKDETLEIDLSGPSSGLLIGGRSKASTTVLNDDGTAQDDNLTGSAFPDQIDGLAGNDTINGLDGADRLFGGRGADTLIGGASDDALIGGAGADKLEGGSGVDIAIYDGGAVTADLMNPSANKGDAAGDTYSSIENLAGSSGDDKLYGDDGANVILGGPPDYSQLVLNLPAAGKTGNDTIYGRGGADTIFAGDGDDFVDGGSGNDFLDGGAGNDTVSFATSSAGVTAVLNTVDDSKYGSAKGDGSDTLSGFENIQGSNFDDSLTGNSGANKLEGLDGSDSLNGGAGDDTLVPGKGNDTLDGGAGTDTVDYSGAGSAVAVDLGAGLPQGAKGVAKSKTDGVDSLVNIENIVGSKFGDTLVGDSSDNLIEGGDGDDTLSGGTGSNILDGGKGDNTVSYAWDTNVGVIVTLNSDDGGGPRGLSADKGTIKDTLKDIQNATGTNKKDILKAGDSGSVLKGLGGDDVLVGGAGDDTLDGGGQTGTLDGKGDWADFGGATAAMTISLSAGSASGQGSDTLIDIENIQGSATKANNISGDGGDNELRGGNGNDVIDGGGGDDVIVGGGGQDKLYGGTGDDTLSKTTTAGIGGLTTSPGALSENGDTEFFGGDGKDTLITGAGDDKAYGGAGNDLIDASLGRDLYDGGADLDELDYSLVKLTAGIKLSLATGVATGGAGAAKIDDKISGIEIVNGTAFDDTLTGDTGDNALIGGAGDDTLDGGGGADQLLGGAGDDTYIYRPGAQIIEKADEGTDLVQSAFSCALPDNVEDLVLEGNGKINGTGNALANVLTGNSGANVLRGLAGNDSLYGGGGADALDGGAGRDLLTGGAGADRFVFSNVDDTPYGAADTIADFVHGVDTIDLSAIDADTKTNGRQAFHLAII